MAAKYDDDDTDVDMDAVVDDMQQQQRQHQVTISGRTNLKTHRRRAEIEPNARTWLTDAADDDGIRRRFVINNIGKGRERRQGDGWMVRRRGHLHFRVMVGPGWWGFRGFLGLTTAQIGTKMA